MTSDDLSSTARIRTTGALEAILDSIGELPSSPAVVGLVMGMTADINSDVRKLSQALSADQAIAAKTLKLSNSPLYGRSGVVGSLEEAIQVLGFFTVRSLVVATATYTMFQIDDTDSPEAQLWEHSLATAIAARLIARKIKHPNAEECYLAGLLHDVGKLVLLQQMQEKFRSVLQQIRETDADPLELEIKEFGFTHCQLGSELVRAWSFPVPMCDAIDDHHKRFEVPRGAPAPMALVVRLANEMTVEIGAGFGSLAAPDIPTERHWSAQALRLQGDDLSDLSDALKENFLEVKGLFY